MALHLRRSFKGQNVVLGLILKSNPVFVREGEEKREKKLGFGRDQTLVGFGSHFFLLKDQTPYKKRLEEVQGNRSTLTSSSMIWIFGKKVLT